MAGSDIEVVDTEEEQIVMWRRSELERAGYDRESAGRLARRADIDLRLAITLLEQGCEPELALRILL